ncbi:HNH endonuclease [Hansschlegelia zhihuaiae]|uniref:HNH endonuclease n=1 Tax=Hansschlegelia zhihuaiae TaxID=405005 RepID=A0A4Q0M8I9_9HYPH|nr:HNH endonuclease signature motif containing protein [Hansschlegelia zhihuaiae]RXF69233.1 HNH endonuclease [Hansschlegelia zhihuaiae]
MPRRPAHFCNCGRIVAACSRCVCQQAADRVRKARHDRNRPSARERGYDRDWQRERAAFLIVNPTCKRCGAQATDVDHIKPHRGDRWLFWDRRNWQALCGHCHDSHKQREERHALKCEALV